MTRAGLTLIARFAVVPMTAVGMACAMMELAAATEAMLARTAQVAALVLQKA